MSLYLGTSKIGNVSCGPLKIGSGADTSDATVTANDLAKGVVAYGKNGKVTGNVTTINSGATLSNPNSTVSKSSDGQSILLTKSNGLENKLIRKGANIALSTSLVNLGNATAADVAQGKTFTSSAGLKVTGTASSSGGGSSISNVFDYIGRNADWTFLDSAAINFLNNIKVGRRSFSELEVLATVNNQVDTIYGADILFLFTVDSQPYKIIASCSRNEATPILLPT